MREITALSLLNAYDACGEIEQFLAGVQLEAYLANRPLQLATERLLEIIGEALSRASKSDPTITTLIPDTRAIIGMRNNIAHGYDQVDNETVWRAATCNVPVPKQEIESLVRAEGHWPDGPYTPGH